MARKAMVTRSIKSLKVRFLEMNLSTKEVTESTAVLANKNYKNNEDILKDLTVCEELKPVHIVSVETEEKLYGMYEDDFLLSAYELDEKRNPITPLSTVEPQEV